MGKSHKCTLPGNARSGFRHCYEMARVHCGDAGFARITSLPRNGPQRHRCHLAGQERFGPAWRVLAMPGRLLATHADAHHRVASLSKVGGFDASLRAKRAVLPGPFLHFGPAFCPQLWTFKATNFCVFGRIRCPIFSFWDTLCRRFSRFRRHECLGVGLKLQRGDDLNHCLKA